MYYSLVLKINIYVKYSPSLTSIISNRYLQYFAYYKIKSITLYNHAIVKNKFFIFSLF